jgi:hypothetical protein
MQVVELITERKGVNDGTFEAIRQDLDVLNKKPEADGPDAKRQRRE